MFKIPDKWDKFRNSGILHGHFAIYGIQQLLYLFDRLAVSCLGVGQNSNLHGDGGLAGWWTMISWPKNKAHSRAMVWSASLPPINSYRPGLSSTSLA